MHPVIDELGVALVLVLALPDHRQQHGKAGLAAGVFLAAGQHLEDR